VTAQRCARGDGLSELALGALAPADAAALDAHVASCPTCSEELAALRPLVVAFGDVNDVTKPSAPLWDRIAQRVGVSSETAPSVPWREPDWEAVAPGISCKLLATDAQRSRVSMLVRLQPRTSYPAHRHAGVEELHLLEGELWIEDRLLKPGDYNRAEPGTGDVRVYSETGCTCVLITSPADRLG
jgi:anti-sigma factor ChrR (cupin superfamily)